MNSCKKKSDVNAFWLHHITSDFKTQYCVFSFKSFKRILNLSDYPVTCYLIDKKIFSESMTFLENLRKDNFTEDVFVKLLEANVKYYHKKKIPPADRKNFYKRITNQFRKRPISEKYFEEFFENEFSTYNQNLNQIMDNINSITDYGAIFCYCGRYDCFLNYIRQNHIKKLNMFYKILCKVFAKKLENKYSCTNFEKENKNKEKNNNLQIVLKNNIPKNIIPYYKNNFLFFIENLEKFKFLILMYILSFKLIKN